MARFYSRFVGRNDLVFDIGANRGNRIEVFLALGARVVAAEPQPRCIEHLRKVYGRRADVELVEKALGAREGASTMMLSENDMISSLNPQWIERARASGRFDGYEWNGRVQVDMTTLDGLISNYGTPRFVKIDVEGLEDEVLEGLSTPVPAVSFEYTPEFIESAIRSADRLSSLGSYEFNYSEGESLRMALRNDVDEQKLVKHLEGLSRKKGAVSGDVYAFCREEH